MSISKTDNQLMRAILTGEGLKDLNMDELQRANDLTISIRYGVRSVQLEHQLYNNLNK